MIDHDVIDAFNARPRVDPNNIKTMTPAQQDQVKAWGSQAEALLLNRELALFIHQYKFELSDELIAVTGHSQDDNARRIAVCNHLAGIDKFVSMLKRATYYKNRLVNLQNGSVDPKNNIKE